MKTFILKILLLILFFAMILAVQAPLFYHYDRKFIREYGFHNHNTEDTIVVCGDSKTEAAINPEILNNTINISISAEHYFFTLSKLRLYLSNNPQTKIVMVGFSYQNITDSCDTFIDDPNRTIFMYPRYFPILNKAQIDSLTVKNLNYYYYKFCRLYGIPNRLSFMPVWAKLNYTEPTKFYEFRGGYVRQVKNYGHDKVNYYSNLHFHLNNDSCKISDSNLNSFYNLVNYCIENRLKIILLNTPMHPDYINNVPAFIRIKYMNTIDSLTRNKRVFYFDHSTWSSDTADYIDGLHLNGESSDKYSKFVQEEINTFLHD